MAPPRRSVAGADLYLKWLPVNETATYFWLAFTAEYIATRNHGDEVLAGQNDWRGAGYAQLVAQVARRWRVGVRGDADGYPRTPFDLRAIVASGLADLPADRVLARALHLPAPGGREGPGAAQRLLLPAARRHHRGPRRPSLLRSRIDP